MSRPKVVTTQTCQSCGQQFVGSPPSAMARRKYCSRACASAENWPRVREHGAVHSAAVRNRRLLARVGTLTAIEAYRVGYQAGYRARLADQR